MIEMSKVLKWGAAESIDSLWGSMLVVYYRSTSEHRPVDSECSLYLPLDVRELRRTLTATLILARPKEVGEPARLTASMAEDKIIGS